MRRQFYYRCLNLLVLFAILIQPLLTPAIWAQEPTPSTSDQVAAVDAAPEPLQGAPDPVTPLFVDPPTVEKHTVTPVTDTHLPSLILDTQVEPRLVSVGQTLTLSLTVTNQAPDAAEEVVVSLDAPEGVTPLPHADAALTAKGWTFKLARLEAGQSVTLSAQARLDKTPTGSAIVIHTEARARGLDQPVQDIGGALIVDQASGEVELQLAEKSKAEGSVVERVSLSTPTSQDKVKRPLFVRGLEPFHVAILDAQGKVKPTLDEPMTIKIRYTPQQLQARGLNEAELQIFQLGAEGQWEALPTDIDFEQRVASAHARSSTDFVIGNPDKPSDAYIPSLKSWQVSLFTGALSFQFPIDAPSGPNGVKPNVSLTYSSAARDGRTGMRPKQQASWVGLGWSLDTGAIARNKVAYDPAIGRWVDSFALTFNGQTHELVRGAALVPNPSEYDLTHWEWHETNQSFIKARIVPNGVSDAQRGGMVNGTMQPRHKWQVQTRDGTLFEFSEDVWNGWNHCEISNAVHFEAYRWLLSQVIDTNGNVITYHYGRQTWAGYLQQCDWWNYGQGLVDQDIWPTAITWGSNAQTGAPDRFKVEFVSSARTNDTEYDGASNQYGGRHGMPRETRRLDAVRVLSMPSATWELVRQYNLSYDYSLLSDQTLFDGTNYVPQPTYPKLTLRSITRVANDGVTALPPMTFDYGMDRGPGNVYAPLGSWNRLVRVNNGQGGSVLVGYDNIGTTLGGAFTNNRRVTSKTLFSGPEGKSYRQTHTWSYSYEDPAYNTIGTILGGAGPQANPNSAVLYYNKFWDPYHNQEGWLVNREHTEFRGHRKVVETDPTGTRVERFFHQGDHACGYPQDAQGYPVGREEAILPHPCFQALRDAEFLKGKERLTRIFPQGSATPIKETDQTHSVAFADYGPAPLTGLWRAFAYTGQTEERTFENGTTPLVKKTNYSYDPSFQGGQQYGNLGEIKEFDQTGAVVRVTQRFFNIRNDAATYIVDRPWQEVIRDGENRLLAVTNYEYDDPNAPGVDGRGRLTLLRKYLDAPLQTSTVGYILHGRDESYTYDEYGNRLTVTTYLGPSTRAWDGSGPTLFSPPGGGSASRTTTTTYDPVFHALPIQTDSPVVNGTMLTEKAQYDLRMGTLTGVIDPNNNQTSAVYDAFGRMIKLIKPGDTVDLPTVQAFYVDFAVPFRYSFVQRENLSHPGAVHPVSIFYDGLGNEIQRKSESRNGSQNIVVDKVYDGRGRVAREAQPRYVEETPQTFWEYTPTPAAGVIWTATNYDALDRPLDITNPDGTTVAHRYRIANGLQLHNVIDANRHNVQHHFDALGRLVGVTEMNGACGAALGFACRQGEAEWQPDASTTYTYNPLDLLTQVRDAQGNQTQVGYNSLGYKLDMADPDMGSWRYAYDIHGKLVRQTDAKSQSILFEYDALDRLTAKRPLKTRWQDDFSDGRLTDWVAAGNVTEANGVLTVTGNGQNWSTHVDRAQAAPGDKHGVSISFKTTHASCPSASLLLDSGGDFGTPNYRRWGVFVCNGQLFLSTFVGATSRDVILMPSRPDTWYRVTLIADGTHQFSVMVEERDNPSVRAVYQEAHPDWSNRQWRFLAGLKNDAIVLDDYVEFSTLDQAVYSYDEGQHGKGRRTAMSNANATTRWSFDGRGRKIWAEHMVAGLPQSRAFEWTYDSADRPVTVKYPQGQVLTYGYDASMRATSLCTSLGGCYVSGAEYTALDQPKHWTLGNGLLQTFTYASPMQRLEQIQVGTGAANGSLFGRRYSYDAVGNVARIDDTATPNAPSQWFLYDQRDRLTEWVVGHDPHFPSIDEAYQYDKIGNLTRKNGQVQEYGRGPCGGGPHAVTRAGGQPFCYDANGNLTSGAGRTLVWNMENQPTSITGPDRITESYKYDADNARVARTRQAMTTYYLEGLWEEAIGGPVPIQPVKTYYVFNGQLVAMRLGANSGPVTFLHGDHLGSVSLSTNGTGAPLSRQEYTPWGETRSGDVTQTDRDFTGQYRDGTGLLFYNARYYDAKIGRFISADSIVPKTAVGSLIVDFHESSFISSLNKELKQAPYDPQTLNRYSYVLNNPLKHTDPSGHQCQALGLDPGMCNWGIGAGAGAFAGGGAAIAGGIEVVAIGAGIAAAGVGLTAGVLWVANEPYQPQHIGSVDAPSMPTEIQATIPDGTAWGSTLKVDSGPYTNSRSVVQSTADDLGQQVVTEARNRPKGARGGRGTIKGAEAAQDQYEGIEYAQRKGRERGTKDIHSIKKSERREKNAFRRIKTPADAQAEYHIPD